MSTMRFTVACSHCGEIVLATDAWFDAVDPLERHMRSAHAGVASGVSSGAMLSQFSVTATRFGDAARRCAS